MALSTKPSDADDPRFLLPRSTECPNDAPAKVVDAGLAGTCGTCAWGFYSMEHRGHQAGEPADRLILERVLENDVPLGYKSRCGKVDIYVDQRGRIGAVRILQGERRFFPGIEENWAFMRYQKAHPALKEAVSCKA